MKIYIQTVLLWLTLLILTYVFWKWSLGYVLPFLLAILMASGLEPGVIWLEKRGVRSGIAVAVTLLIGVSVGCLAVLGLLSVLLAELVHLTRTLPFYLSRWQTIWEGNIRRLGHVQEALGISKQGVHGQLNNVYHLVESLLRSVLGIIAGLPNLILVLIVALVAAFFVLRDRHWVSLQLRRALPPNLRPKYAQIKGETLRGVTGLIKAQVSLVAVTAVATSAGLIIIDAPYAVLVGLAAGVLDMVPFMGPTFLLVPWAVTMFMVGHAVMGFELLGVLMGVGVLRQVLEPRLVGNQTGLHPLIALLSLYIGVRVFGANGFIIGPISGVVLKAMSQAINETLVTK